MATMPGPCNALSIDVEEWFHAELIRGALRDDRPQRRVAWATEPILNLLDRYDVRATFFVVGDVLRHEAALVRRIYDAGHEIACHGWSHRPLWGLDPERFAWELEEFDRHAQELLPVEEIIGFRAPTFSLDERTAWALDLLAARGYRYDSSLFPMRTKLYGVPNGPRRPYRPRLSRTAGREERGSAEGLIEFPMTVAKLWGFDIPVAGGVYMRMLPLAALTYLLGRVNDEGAPFVLYMHPWEADLGTPKVPGLPAPYAAPLAHLGMYGNRGSTLVKLEALLSRFRFAPLREVLGLDGERRASSAGLVGEGVDAGSGAG